MVASSDVVVVGGGIIGLAIARQAARAGLSVRLLEKGQPGRESSGAAAGMLGVHLESERIGPLDALALESRGLYADFARQVESESGIDPALTREGALLLAGPGEPAASLERRCALHRAAGLRVEHLGADDLRRLEPGLAPGVEGALFLPDEACVDNVLLVRGLHLAASRAGVRVHAGTPVSHLLVEDGRVVGVAAAAERFPASAVVIAAGAWSGGIDGPGSPALPTHPVRGQIVCFDPPEPAFRRILFREAFYLVRRRAGRVLAGSTMERVGFDARVTAAALASLTGAALALVPALGDAPFHSAWAGLRPATDDGLPAIGRGALPGLLYACGHLRNGILLAPVTARLVVALLRGQDPGMDLAPFSPLRFATAAGPRGR